MPINGAERIEAALRGKKGLVAYVTAGDPSLGASVEIMLACERGGADVIELGVPFSDPSADGPVIQRAMQRAIGAGGSLRATLEVVRKARARGLSVPIVLFGYYNPLYVLGVERFAQLAADAGADGALIVDLPPEEGAELYGPLRERGLAVIPLLAPTSTPDRVALATGAASGFIYYVALTGVTGAALDAGARGDLTGRVAAIRQETALPIAVGFGIATPADAAAIAKVADAAVVGSAIVREIEAHPQAPAPAVERFVRGLSAALRP